MRGRLLLHIERRYGDNRSAFARALDVPRQTVTGWLQEKDPNLPNAGQLVAIAKRTNLSLNWLLLGTEPWFRGELVHAGDIGTHLRSALVTDMGGEFGAAERVAAALSAGETLFARLRDFCREFVHMLPETTTTPSLYTPPGPVERGVQRRPPP